MARAAGAPTHDSIMCDQGELMTILVGKGYKGKGFANATDTYYYWDENAQDFVQFISEGTEGTEAGGDGDGDDAAVVPEEHAEAVEDWNPSFVDYWEDEY